MDKYLVSLAILLLFLEGLWLTHDLSPNSFGFSTSQTQGQSIGKITKHKSQVRKRAQDSLIWEDTEKEQSLYAYDSVLTLNESAAEIELLGNSLISLNENTMVVIEPPLNGKAEGPLRLRFKRGNIKTTTGEKSQTIATDDFVIEAAPNTKMNLRSKGNAFHIDTLNGEVKILNSQSLAVAQIIKSGENASIVDQKITRSPAAVNLEWGKPVDNERVYTHGNSAQVVFDWKGDVTALEINDQKSEVNQAPLSKTLSLGNYTAKLYSNHLASSSKTIHVWQAPKIYAISPAQNQRFKKQDEVSFLWSQTVGVATFDLQVSKDKDFQKIEHSFKSEEAGTSLENLESGHWYWRVQGRDDAGFVIPELNFGEFYILDNPLEAPKTKAPKIKKGARLEKPLLQKLFELLLPSADAADKKFYFAEFQWEKLEGAQGYVIEISSEPDFRNLLTSQRVKTESFKWKNFKLGRYYWRVAGEDSSGQLGLYSDAALADLTQIPTEPVTANYVAPKPKLAPSPAAVAVVTPAPTAKPVPPEDDDAGFTDIYLKGMDIDFEIGTHGDFRRFKGGDFSAQNFGIVLGDFRVKLTPPERSGMRHWQSETEMHLYALSGRPATQFPFQNILMTSIFRQTFIKNNSIGFTVNQTLGFKRADLERLGFENYLSAGPVFQWDNTRVIVLLGQTYSVEGSYLYQVERLWTDSRSWIFSLEGRAGVGITLNKDFFYEAGAYLWLGVRWK